MRELLISLCSLDGVSGQEDAVCDFIRAHAEPYADDIKTDPAGNLMVLVRGKSGGRPLMAAAHMDEVGFIITGATSGGLLRFGNVGGITSDILPGTRVRVGDKKLPGIIGLKPVHLTKPGERKKIPDPESLYIDIGARGRDDALSVVSPGDYASFVSKPEFFGDGYFRSKAIDDRLGCAVLMELMKKRVSRDVWYTFTVMEEIGSGVQTAAYRIAPEAGFVIECTTAADLPAVKGALRTTTLGAGAAIPTADRSTVYYLSALARECAERIGAGWQDKTTVAGGTDAGKISVSGFGVPMAAISAPGRYLHSPVSVIKWSDAEAVRAVSAEFIETV